MPGPEQRIRYERIRVADLQNDQLTAAVIAAGGVPGSLTQVTQQDLQQFFLSQLKRAIWGDHTGHWYDDFEADGVASLFDLVIDFLLENDPPFVGTTYTPTYVGSKVSQELWVITATSKNLKEIQYTYTGNKATQVVVQVFAANGVTVIGQTTTTYTYTGNRVIQGVTTRDV